jgi:hypothetical protein
MARLVVHGVQQGNFSQSHLLIVVWLSGAPCLEILKRACELLCLGMQALHTQDLLCHLAEFASREHIGSHIGVGVFQRGLLYGHRRAASHHRARQECVKDKCREQPPEHRMLSLLISSCRQLCT